MLQRAHTAIKMGRERSDIHFYCSLRDDIYLAHINLPSPYICMLYPSLSPLAVLKAPEEVFKNTASPWLSNMFSEVTLPKH